MYQILINERGAIMFCCNKKFYLNWWFSAAIMFCWSKEVLFEMMMKSCGYYCWLMPLTLFCIGHITFKFSGCLIVLTDIRNGILPFISYWSFTLRKVKKISGSKMIEKFNMEINNHVLRLYEIRYYWLLGTSRRLIKEQSVDSLRRLAPTVFSILLSPHENRTSLIKKPLTCKEKGAP